MYRNCTNNYCCYPYNPCYCCYCNYCCCNPAIYSCECQHFVCQVYAGNTKCCSFRRISDMPSKKKSSFDSIGKPKKKKKMECTCNEKHMTICKRIQEIDKKLGRCKCMATSDDDPCSSIATQPVVNDGKREVYLLPYYGVPIKKNKKYILECTSFESTDASCCETPDNSNNNQDDWCPRLPPECDTHERSALPKSQTGETNFVGRCTSFESLASLQPTKRTSCHCCCSRKASNSKSKRHGSATTGKSWSQLDVIDEEDMDLMEDCLQQATKKKASKIQANSSKLQSPRKYDASPNANASASTNRNSRGIARSNGIACCCTPVNANVRGNSKSNASCCAAAKAVESKMQKSLEDSCADFLNIVTDNILESVQQSVSVTLKDYCTKTTEKIDQAFEKLEQNDVAMRCLCGRLMEKLTEQNEREYEKILCLLEELKESQQSKQNSIEKIYVQSRASQYEVTESFECGMQPMSPCGFQQPVAPYYGPQASSTRQSTNPESDFRACSGQQSMTPPQSYAITAQTTNPESVFKKCCGQQSVTPPQSYAKESITAQTTNPESAFRACCGQQSVTQPQSSPDSPRTAVNCCGQKENLENGNGKNGNGKNGNGNEQCGKAPDEIVVNEVQSKENENQQLVGKVIIPPCRCCHKCTCTPKPTYTGPPRPNICLETDEKKKSNGRECGGSTDQCSEEGEETLSPSEYHFVSDKGKPKANVLENKSSLNDSIKSGVRTSNNNSATKTESRIGMFNSSSINSSKKTVFLSTTNNSTANVPSCCGKDKNTPELDLYGNYDTSGYATEPEDNNDGIDGTSAHNAPIKKSQFLPVTLQYVRNDTATKTGTTNRNTTAKKHCKKRTACTSKSPSSRLSRL